MRRIPLLLVLALMALLPLSAQADGRLRLVDMVPLLPLADGDHPDIDDLMARHWHDFYRAAGPDGFGPADLRAGRIDLNGDGDDELVLMVDAPRWRSDDGQPFVIATWRNHAWLPVGWGWADDDGIFVTDQVNDSWHTLDAGKYLMPWGKDGYQRVRKP